MLDQFPTGLIACVSDSFDIYNACTNLWGGILKDKVLARDGCLVVRPDSGYPPEIVVEVLYRLGQAFGYTENSKGYKVLNPKVRVIQGDGVDMDMIKRIYAQMEVYGWSGDNLAFGMGGALLQKLNRDTQKFAFKCSSATIDGNEVDVYKEPVTDSGKNSKRGRLKLIKADDSYATLSAKPRMSETSEDQLVEVFRDGAILKKYTFEEIRKRSNNF
jgi:nicotinamide phosphoribosyltransferase